MPSIFEKWHPRHLPALFALSCFPVFITPSYAADGDLVWQSRFDGFSYDDSRYDRGMAVGVSGEIAVNQGGYLYVFNADGTEKWNSRFSDTVFIGTPVIGADGTIYIATGLTYYRATRRGLIAYNSDGSVKWNRNNIATSNIAIAADNTLYVNSSGSLDAIDNAGVDVWTFALDNGYVGSPVVGNDGTVYVRSNNKVLAIAETGKLKWTYNNNASILTPLALTTDGSIYFGDENDAIIAVNTNGVFKQQIVLAGRPSGSLIIGSDDAVYATVDNSVVALKIDGSTTWTYQTTANPTSLMLLQDNSVVVNVDKKLLSLSSDGKLNWLSAIFGTEPTIASDGTLFVRDLVQPFDPTSGYGKPYGLLTAIESSAGGLANGAWPKAAHNAQNTGFNIHAGVPANTYQVDFETGKLDQAPLLLSGDANWQVNSAKAKAGSFSVKSPSLTEANQQATLEITALTTDHYVSFDYSLNTTDVNQQLSFYIDNVLKGRWYGDVDWQQLKIAVDEGIHTFTWKFSSTQPLTDEQQGAWLDNIRIVYSTGDVDGDDIADNLDTDNDNDGVLDHLDDQPLNASLTSDYDRDGISDDVDVDDDNDGVNDDVDPSPQDKNIGIASGDGSMLRSFKTMSGNILSSAAIANDGSIYIGSVDGRLYAFDSAGDLAWYYQTQDKITASPVIADDGTIYIGSYDKNLYALNPDGSLKWQVALDNFIDTAPAIHPDGNIYVQAAGISTISPEGELLTQGSIYSFCSRNMASPSISPQGDIYYTYDQAYEYDSCSSKLVIKPVEGDSSIVSASLGTSPAIASDGTLYISNNNTIYDPSYPDFNPITYRQLTAYTSSGTKKWTTSFPNTSGGLTSAVIADNDLIYMGADRFYALNSKGEILRSLATDNPDDYFTSAPVIAADGTVFIGASDHQLYAINADGSKKWSFQTAGTILSSPTITHDGHVVFGSNDGRVYILNSDAGTLADAPWPVLGQSHRNSRFLKQDTDKDGQFDHVDNDDDNDGVADSDDQLIYDPSEQTDFDGDGVGDNADSDDDNDGVPDSVDNAAKDALVGASSGDGLLNEKLSITSIGELQSTDSLATGPDGTRYGIGAYGQVVYAFNSDDTFKWRYLLGGVVSANSPYERVRIASDGTLLVSTGDLDSTSSNRYTGGASIAINPDGTVKWKYAPEDNALHQTLAVGFDNVAYISVITEEDNYKVNTLVALLPNGEVKWRYQGAKIKEVVVAEQTLYLTATFDLGAVIALDLSGNEKWIKHFDGAVNNPVVDAAGNVYVSYDHFDLKEYFALTPEGQLKWHLTLDRVAAKHTLINTDGSVLFVQDETLYAYGSTGSLLWSYSLNSSLYSSTSSPIIAEDGTIFVATYDNKVHAITSVGESRWIYQSNERIDSDLYISDDGNVYFYSQEFRHTINSDAGVLANTTWAKQFADVRNTSQAVVDSDGDGLVNNRDPDDDNDGILDRVDACPVGSLGSTDTDGDAICNTSDSDDDNDGLPDEFELANGLNALDANDALLDSDDDGLTILEEYQAGTDIGLADTDGDGITDGREVAAGFDPLDANSTPVISSENDLNNDGIADVIWRNLNTGQNWVYLMNAGKIATSKTLGYRRDLGWHIVGRGDFNNDGVSDILWRHQETGDNEIEILSDVELTTISEVIPLPLRTTDKQVLAVADANGDGTDDIFWYDRKTSEVIIDLVQDHLIVGEISLLTLETNWQIEVVGDFNADGTDDLWLRNDKTGANRTWLLNDGNITDKHTIRTVDPMWYIQGVADVDADGDKDVMWRDKSGRRYIHLMQDGLLEKATQLPDQSLEWRFAMAGDLDGNGTEDIIWHNQITGKVLADFMVGDEITNQQTVTTIDKTSWQIAPLQQFSPMDKASKQNDNNADGKADVLWHNEVTGQDWLWTMNGRSVTDSRQVYDNSNGFSVAGRGDLNGDGKSDVVFRGKESWNGTNWLFLMDGPNKSWSGRINEVPDLDWHIKGVADFDGDGKSDILWHHQQTGQSWLYLMDSYKLFASRSLRKISDLNWEVAATPDVNGDGKADIYWRHKTNGRNYIWLMDGATVLSAYTLPTISTAWQLVGSGDLDADGTDDIVWRNKNDGRNWAHLLKQGRVETSKQINTIVDDQWHIKNIADYDGDGKADIFWRHQTTGKSYIYLMDGVKIKENGFSRTVSTDWKVMGN